MKKKKNDEDCSGSRKSTRVSRVKVEENGRSAVFINPKNREFYITRVDGGVVKNKLSADYVVTQVNVGDLIVELKGKEVGRACEQIIATVEHMKNCHSTRGPFAGLVVCTRVPRTDTKSQRLQNNFMQMYRRRLKIRASNSDYRFEDFFP